VSKEAPRAGPPRENPALEPAAPVGEREAMSGKCLALTHPKRHSDQRPAERVEMAEFMRLFLAARRPARRAAGAADGTGRRREQAGRR